ncbi:MAG TPA: hypothetical protein VFX61_07580 [Micromonosporaceae bacterium]|nr:hypothetical protein [Micromonosporaceae bacterium]
MPPPAATEAPGAAEPAKSSGGKKILSILGVIVVVVVIGFFKFGVRSLFGDELLDAKVGDCLVGQTEKDLKVVKCDDPTAEWKVVGTVSGKTEAEFNAADDGFCGAYPDFEIAYWEGTKGKAGNILCMEPVQS